MAIPRSMGWLVVTGAVVLLLVALSLFALDRPNVVWGDGKPACPQCRSSVIPFAQRCGVCREEFDWVPTPDEASPACVHCLTPLEEDAARERRRALGEEKAAVRAATALGVAPAAADEYLKATGSGQCGWCGGTGHDLAAPDGEKAPCPVCFGGKRCVACGGDRRVRFGVEAADVEIKAYLALVPTLESTHTPVAAARRELAKAAQAFLARHIGTREAASLLLGPRFRDPQAPRRPGAAAESRLRLDAVLDALAKPE